MRAILLALTSALLAAASTACVHSSYETGNVQNSRGSSFARGPIYVDIDRSGTLSALGRSFSDPNKLARYLRAAKATPVDGGGRAVVIRCLAPRSIDQAEALRETLIHKGIPNISIQGPRTATATLGEERFL